MSCFPSHRPSPRPLRVAGMPHLLLAAALVAGCSDDPVTHSAPGNVTVVASLGLDLSVGTGTRLHVRVTGGGTFLGEEVVALPAGSRQWEVVLVPRADVPVGVPLQADAWITDPSGRTLWSGEATGTIPSQGGTSIQLTLRAGGPAAGGVSAVRIAGEDVLELVEGTSLGLEVQVDGGPASALVFLVDDPSVAQVDGSGRIVALAPGATRLVAMAGLGADSVTVRVSGRIDRLAILPGPVTLAALGETRTLQVRGLDSRGIEVAIPGPVLWSSRDERIVGVDGEGSVTARANGETVVVARLQGDETVEGSLAVSVQQAVASLAFVRGGGQEGRVGDPLPEAPLVRLLDERGNPVPGVRVSFDVVRGGGRVVHASRVTDAGGEAGPGDWVMGGSLGLQELRAAEPGGASAVLQATAVTGRPARLVALSPLLQDGTAGRDAAEPPAIRVEDQGGNPVAGIDVAFQVLSGGGNLTPAAVRTGADGVARSNRWRLGLVLGTQLAEAAASGLSLDFAVTAEAGEPASVVVTDGGGQDAVVNSVLPVAPQVRVTDGGGNPVGGVPVTFVVLSGGGSITGDAAVTDADGRARVGSWQLGTVAGANALEVVVAGGITTVVGATGLPGPASAPHSTLSVAAHADGDSTVVATVTVRDAWGNVRTAGGDSPQITGPLGAAAVTDRGDGTYEAAVALATSRAWEVSLALVSEIDVMAGAASSVTMSPVDVEVFEAAPGAPYLVDIAATLGGTDLQGSPAATSVIPAHFPAFRITSWWARSEAALFFYWDLPEMAQQDVFPVGDFDRTEEFVSASQSWDGRSVTTTATAGLSRQGGVLSLDLAGTHTAVDADHGGFARSGMRVITRSFRPLVLSPGDGCFQQVLPGGSYWRSRTAVDDIVSAEWVVDRSGPGDLGTCP